MVAHTKKISNKKRSYNVDRYDALSRIIITTPPQSRLPYNPLLDSNWLLSLIHYSPHTNTQILFLEFQQKMRFEHKCSTVYLLEFPKSKFQSCVRSSCTLKPFRINHTSVSRGALKTEDRQPLAKVAFQNCASEWNNLVTNNYTAIPAPKFLTTSDEVCIPLKFEP